MRKCKQEVEANGPHKHCHYHYLQTHLGVRGPLISPFSGSITTTSCIKHAGREQKLTQDVCRYRYRCSARCIRTTDMLKNEEYELNQIC